MDKRKYKNHTVATFLWKEQNMDLIAANLSASNAFLCAYIIWKQKNMKFQLPIKRK